MFELFIWIVQKQPHMKKIIASFLTAFIAISAMAQGGHLKVTFVGFDCLRETWDDILNSDGKGDEVYFNFGVTLANRNGDLYNQYDKRTKVYGDNSGPWSNRILAGSCVDAFGNNKGGIRAGDSYRTNELIGEYDIADGDIVTCFPTGWEYDPIADNLNSFTSTLSNGYLNLNKRLGPMMMGVNLLTGNINGLIFQSTALGLSKINAGGEQGDLGRAGTRPIGMEKYGAFNVKLVAVNSKNLPVTVNSDYGYGRGVVAVNYDENAVGNSRDHGNYTILLRFEYTPRPMPPAPNPGSVSAPVATTGTPVAPTRTPVATTGTPVVTTGTPIATTGVAAPSRVIKSVPVKNTTTLATPRTVAIPMNVAKNVSLVGHWTGIQVNDEGLYPQNVQFDLLDNGEFQIRGANGALASQGTWTYVNNLFTATLKQFSSSETFTYQGSYDPGAQTLNLTAGMDKAIKGQGRFTMKRN